MHPDDVAALDLVDGSLVEVRSAHGALVTRVAADNTMRRGVAAMTHGWGGNIGTNVNLLTDRIAGRDPINAMPILTGFAVTIRRHNAAAV
jgi:anaerobic selenocysteine-containing dehydrogenase